MAKYRECERDGCNVEFDITDHKHQRFCSKSCAKMGTRYVHDAFVRKHRDKLEEALNLIRDGWSYRQASDITGISRATIWTNFLRTKK